ncbi:MAG: orotidine-5'-phosphate decarboxylase [Candidatus Bilamarchaeaceae archaeon]
MLELLRSSAEERKTILCFGMDPVLEKIREEGDTRGKVVGYYSRIIDKLLDENEISALKPNYAYFAQYGFEGLHALKELIERYRNRVPVILDGKRGDIGKTSEAYAKEAYGFWGADAVTVAPYMGEDSVRPFCAEGKLAYMLCRTSNKGGVDFQELKFKGKRLYEHVALKSLEWKTGLVVGATSTAIRKIVKLTENKVPLLVPGVGAQGGDLRMALNALKGDLPIHRINSSSGIAFAYEKNGGSPEDAALAEARETNRTIRRYWAK